MQGMQGMLGVYDYKRERIFLSLSFSMLID